MPKVQRLTLFKIPDAADVDKAIEAYGKVEANNQKDGKPYILQTNAYKLHEDQRSQGYTLAHGALKTEIKPYIKGGPPLILYMDFE